MSREWKYAVVDLSTNSTTVSDVPCIVKGFYVNTTMSAHECLVKDNTTTVIRIPASTAAAAASDFDQLRFETSLVVDPDDSATGELLIMFDQMEQI